MQQVQIIYEKGTPPTLEIKRFLLPPSVPLLYGLRVHTTITVVARVEHPIDLPVLANLVLVSSMGLSFVFESHQSIEASFTSGLTVGITW